MLDLHAAPPATVTRLLLVIIFSTCLATHTAAFASSKTVLSSPVITAVGRQQYTSLHRHTIETSKNNHLRLRRDGLAMSSATTAMAAIPIADSAFWIGFYGLLQVTLWIKIMTIRSVQSQSTHQLQSLASSQDIRNLRATRAHGNYTENAPIFSLLLLVVDALNVVPKLVVNALGSLFFFGRVFHMIGLWKFEGSTLGRMMGAICTMLSLILGSCLSIYSAGQVMEGGFGGGAVKGRLGIIAMIVAAGTSFAGIIVEKQKE